MGLSYNNNNNNNNNDRGTQVRKVDVPETHELNPLPVAIIAPFSSSSGSNPESVCTKKRKFTKSMNQQRQSQVYNVYEYVNRNNLGRGHISETDKILKLHRQTVRKIINIIGLNAKKDRKQ